jgi:hypothetical protein
MVTDSEDVPEKLSTGLVISGIAAVWGRE